MNAEHLPLINLQGELAQNLLFPVGKADAVKLCTLEARRLPVASLCHLRRLFEQREHALSAGQRLV